MKVIKNILSLYNMYSLCPSAQLQAEISTGRSEHNIFSIYIFLKSFIYYNYMLSCNFFLHHKPFNFYFATEIIVDGKMTHTSCIMKLLCNSVNNIFSGNFKGSEW